MAAPSAFQGGISSRKEWRNVPSCDLQQQQKKKKKKKGGGGFTILFLKGKFEIF